MTKEHFAYNQEISQAENLNATARLWIQPDQTVFKEYVIRNELTYQNIVNLLLISKIKNLYKFPEIVMPLTIVRDSDQVLGYTMPYVSGITLNDFLDNKNISNYRKLNVLISLADVINRMPKGVYIGDLHAKNIIVDEKDKIHLIDIDGFSLRKGYQISCPAEYWLKDTIWFLNKKYWKNGKFVISNNTDIICWYMIFIRWLMNASPLMYTQEEVCRYFSYLKSIGFPTSIYDDILRLSSRRCNIIIIEHIKELYNKEINLYSYHEYRKWYLLNKRQFTE